MARAVDEDTISECLSLLLRPIASLCLRHGVRIQKFLEIAKTVFVWQAKQELINRGAKHSDSRISAMTGLQRREVARVTAETPSAKKSLEMLTKILGNWHQHPDFIDEGSQPKPLSWKSKNSEFADLVRSVSMDLNPYTVLFEFERQGLIKKDPQQLYLLGRELVDRDDISSGFSLLGDDVDSLINGVEENILGDEIFPNLHLHTFYDQITAESEEEIRQWLLCKGTQFHKEARDYLSKFDCDLNPNLENARRRVRVTLGTFSHVKKPGSIKEDDS